MAACSRRAHHGRVDDWRDWYNAKWLLVAVLIGCCAFAGLVLLVIIAVVRLAG
jgi:hypothetical protein